VTGKVRPDLISTYPLEDTTLKILLFQPHRGSILVAMGWLPHPPYLSLQSSPPSPLLSKERGGRQAGVRM